MHVESPLLRRALLPLCCCAFWLLPAPAVAQVVYVDAASSCTAGCGTAWADAYPRLQDALADTDSGEIWVAAGTYRPSDCTTCTTTDREQFFPMKNNVALYGGFAGTETSRQQRDIDANPTILSGDIGAPADSTDNCFRVLIAENVDSTAVLDGFIVEEGNADGPFGFALGGGLFIDATGNTTGSPIVRHCTFRNNYATGGGGIGMDGSGDGTLRPTIRNCLFEGNTCSLQAVSRGAAALITATVGATAEPQFISCTFRNNYSGDDGGAIAINITSTVTLNSSFTAVRIDSCLFENNESVGAFGRGGAIWMLTGSNTESRHRITNSQFINNTAGGHGGAIFNRASFALGLADDRIVNCRFDGNRSLQDGGAIYFRGTQGATNTGQAVNCAFYDNQAALNGGAVFTTSFSDVEGITQNQLASCSFYGNTAQLGGGALYLDGAAGGSNAMELNNSVLWGDEAGAGEAEIQNDGATASASHCILEGGLPPGVSDEGNNIFEDPQYAAPSTGSLHLLSCSPGIDAGLNAIIPATLINDLDGEPRIQNNVIDIGAYESGRLFVDQDATGSNNGRSWQDAYTDLQDALAAASPGDQVWVAEGIYRPDSCTTCTDAQREKAFSPRNGVELYGGFAGVEDQREQRDVEANVTILSGDIGLQNDSTDNAYQVVRLVNAGFKTTVDGFTIEQGNADGSFSFSSGGGIYINGTNGRLGNPLIQNCTIRNNYATSGGGIGMDGSGGGVIRAQVRHCLIADNTCARVSVNRGGGVLILGSVEAAIEPQFIECTFRDNFSGDDGGAMALNVSSTDQLGQSFSAVRIDSCLFEGNESEGLFGRGGAIWMLMGTNTESRNVISNTRFLNNTGGGNGGAVFNRASFSDNRTDDRFINCFFAGNISGEDGGALYFRGSQGGVNTSRAFNCAFFDNQAARNGGAVFSTAFSTSAGTTQNQLTNCSFYANNAQQRGGALFLSGVDGGVNEMEVNNSILWGDTSTLAGNEIINNGATLSLSHCIVEGGFSGPGAQDAVQSSNPFYLDPDAGNLALSPCSPAVNAGRNDFLPIDSLDLDADLDSLEVIDIDLNGDNRLFEGITDLGALEWNGTPTALDTIEAQVTTISCVGLCDGQLQALPVGGTPGYTFLWATGDTANTITGLCAGTYTVTVTDANGCRDSLAIPLEEPELLIADAGPNTAACDGSPVTLNASATGGNGGYSYSWSNNAGNTASVTVTPDGSEEYIVTVTDSRNCTASDTMLIQVIDNPEPEINGDTNFCEGQGTTLETGAYESYLWSTGDTTDFLVVNTSGNYSLTVTDELGCTGEASVQATALETPMPQVSGSLTFCAGGATILDAGVYENYLWSTGGFTQTITVNTEGSITVTVVNGQGCTGQASVVVTEQPELTPQISGDTLICSGGSTTLDAGAYESYQWSTSDTTQAISVSQPGIYGVTVTNTFGCTGQGSVQVGQNPSIVPEITGEFFICPDSSTVLDAGPYEGFSWSTGDTTQTITVDSGGVYTVIVTDGAGCTGQTSELVTQGPDLLPLDGVAAAFCPGDSTTLDAGPFETYLWSTGDTTQAITVDTEGAYSITVTDELGCAGDTTITVTQNASPIPQASGALSFCPGATTTLDAGFFESYQWSTGDTTQAITVGSEGTYSVTVADELGCTGDTTVTVIQNENPVPQISGPLSFCPGATTTLDAGPFESYLWSTGDTTQTTVIGNAGTASVTVTDGQGCSGTASVDVVESSELMPQVSGALSFCPGTTTSLDAGVFDTYLWNTGDTTQAITVSAAGNYAVTVTDGAGCSGDTAVTVSQSPAPTPQIDGLLSFCPGEATTLDAGIFETYLWNTGDTTQAIVASAEGAYAVTVTNEAGCTGEAVAEVSQSPAPAPQVGGQLSFCPGETTTLDAGAFENYLWSTGETTPTITVGVAGLYSVTVTDAGGCSGTASADVTPGGAPNATIIASAPAVCAGESLELLGDGASTYQWLDATGTLEVVGPTSALVRPETTTDYLLIGSNACGTDTARITITVLTAPQVNVGEAPPLRAGESLSLLATGADRYEWLPGLFLDCTDCPNPTATPDSSITYLVVGIGENGCRDTASLFLDVLDKEVPLIDPVNTITPNGDGVNDFFVIPELAFYPDHKLSIINRWGDVVFESRNYEGDWNGTYKGKDLPAGTYLYVLVVEIEGDPFVIRKTITIIRE